MLSRLFRRLFLQALRAAFAAGELSFFSDLAELKERDAFERYLTPLRRSDWVVYAKRPFAGPSQVLAYLARYTHRVAISNSRLISLADGEVRFRWKDYRQAGKGKVMALATGEFIRRFLMHTLPDGFHRIRYYGLFANGHRADKLNLCRRLLDAPTAPASETAENADGVPTSVDEPHTCPSCGGRMIVIETFEGSHSNGSGSALVTRFDSS